MSIHIYFSYISVRSYVKLITTGKHRSVCEVNVDRSICPNCTLSNNGKLVRSWSYVRSPHFISDIFEKCCFTEKNVRRKYSVWNKNYFEHIHLNSLVEIQNWQNASLTSNNFSPNERIDLDLFTMEDKGKTKIACFPQFSNIFHHNSFVKISHNFLLI